VITFSNLAGATLVVGRDAEADARSACLVDARPSIGSTTHLRLRRQHARRPLACRRYSSRWAAGSGSIFNNQPNKGRKHE
jgi:hypothetical protein